MFAAQLVPEPGQPGAEAFLPRLGFPDAAIFDPVKQGLPFGGLPLNQPALMRLITGVVRVDPLLQFPFPAGERGLHVLGECGLGLIQRRQRVGFTQTGAHVFGFDACPFGEGIDFPLMIDGQISPAIPTSQRIAAFLEGMDQRGLVVRDRPGILQGGLDFAWIAPLALGLLPFIQRKITRIAAASIRNPLRHFPAMFEIEFAREVLQLEVRIGKLDRLHLFNVDPAPHGVSVAAAFLFMEDDDAGLIRQAQLGFRARNGVLKGFGADLFAWRRVERQREEELLAARPLAQGISLLKRTLHIVRRKASHFMHGDMIVLAGKKVGSEITPAAALIADQDHGLPPAGGKPKADSKASRMMRISRQAFSNSSSSAGETTRTPIWAALAIWLRLFASRDWPSVPRTLASPA